MANNYISSPVFLGGQFAPFLGGQFHRFFHYIAIIGYFDAEILSPLLLPDDLCYYHIHQSPLWMDWFYISSINNGHPAPASTIPNLLILLLLGFSLGYVTMRKLSLKLSKDVVNN